MAQAAWAAQNRRRTIPAERNPMDKCTIVSIYRRDIDETKHTIQPGRFRIAPGSYEKPALLVVGSSSWWREIDDEQPLLEIPNSSIQVADSIVKDYCNGLLGCNMVDSMPGLFYVKGEWGLLDLQQKHKKLLEAAKHKQDNWFNTLIRLADMFWARSNGNPLTISDDMRMAAQELNRKEKEWMSDFTMMQKVNCPACGSPRNPDYPICPTCKAIADPEKAAKMGIKFAQV